MINITILAWLILQMDDFMHHMGKMYVVVAVVVLVLVGIFAYLIYMDRKMSRLEKKIDKENGRTRQVL